MVEEQNVSFIYDLPDNCPTGLLKINFAMTPFAEGPSKDPTIGMSFRFDIEEAD